MRGRQRIFCNDARGVWQGRFHDEHPRVGRFFARTLANVAELEGLPESERRRVLETRWEDIRRTFVETSPSVLVSVAAEAWFHDLSLGGRREGTIVLYRRTLRRFCGVCGDIPVSMVKKQEVVGYLTHCKANLTPPGVAKEARNLHAFLNWAHREGLAPPPNIPTVRVDTSEPRPYTDAEVMMVEDYLVRRNLTNALRVWRMVRCTGMRAGEVLELKLGDIGQSRITLRRTKQRRVRTVPISTQLREIIDSDRRGFTEVWYLDRGDGVRHWHTQTGLSQTFRRIIDQLGLVGYKPLHSLRSWVAVKGLANGADVTAVRDLLGHGSINTTLRYLSFVRLQGNTAELVEGL